MVNLCGFESHLTQLFMPDETANAAYAVLQEIGNKTGLIPRGIILDDADLVQVFQKVLREPGGMFSTPQKLAAALANRTWEQWVADLDAMLR